MKSCWLIIALIREMTRLVDDAKMWTAPYGSTQVTLLGIDDGREVTPNRALVLFVASEARVHVHVLWNSGVSVTELLPLNDGAPGNLE
jgi:hypothetical protein